MSEPKLIVYKPFGVPTEKDVFDDVKTHSLWPVTPSLPKLVELAIFTYDAPGANGINGIEAVYEVNIGGPLVYTKHGELSGKRNIIDIVSKDIADIIATVVKENLTLVALTFVFSDGSKQGLSNSLYPGVLRIVLTKCDLTEVSASGVTVGFYGSLNEKGMVKFGI
ncbi:hypothetical protein H0H92_002774 [Tricholoma furcatifolium]|nr:hypothetical protein H0H92_002774 [Tricholoma furcatifolium]